MERFFVDTSAWYAFANAKDPSHARVADVLRARGRRLVSSNFVFDETVTLCASRLGRRVAERVGSVLLDPTVVDTMRVSASDEHAAWRLFLARGDQSCSFTDCTSFVLMRRVGIDTAVALDDDFRIERFRLLP